MSDPLASPKPTRHRRIRLLLLAFATATLASLLIGCSEVRYYRQAVAGHLDIVRRQTPIPKLLADPTTPTELRQQLQRLLALRAFAQTNLGLPANGHYLRYADLGRRHVVWNLYAAAPNSLDDHTWWYPFVGRLSYRGFFNEPDAHAAAQSLKQRGLETYVQGVTAYSTLGWFRDPVLNTFIHRPDWALAEILFHELAHQRFFVSGHTDFNEAFATAVAEEGVRRWLQHQGRRTDLEHYETHLNRERQFNALVLRARSELETLFALPDTTHRLEVEKPRILADLRTRYQAWKQSQDGYNAYDRWMNGPLNNPQLNTVATYYELVPAFHALLARSAGQLDRFYREVERIGHRPRKERIQTLQNAAPVPSQ